MNDIITLSQLITRLAKVTGSDPNTARRFLKAFFTTVEEQLAAGESVTIKNIGTFRRSSSDPLEKSEAVVFIPDASIVDEVNRPFNMFDAVELAPGVDFEQEAEPVQEPEGTNIDNDFDNNINNNTAVSVSDNIPVDIYEPQTVEETIIKAPSAEVPAPAPAPTPTPAPAPAPTPAPQPVVRQEPPNDDDDSDDRVPQKRKKRSLMWLWITIAVLLACVGGYFAAVHSEPIPDLYDDTEELADSVSADTTEIVITEVDINTSEPVKPAAAKADEPKPVTAQAEQPKQQAQTQGQEQTVKPAKKVVYDTVDVSLTRLAIKHYHENFFWVYIYEANRDVISNPNTIRPGTKVVIPDRSTFPGATPEEARSIARNKQAEILARFK